MKRDKTALVGHALLIPVESKALQKIESIFHEFELKMSIIKENRETKLSEQESLLHYSPIPQDLMEKLFGFCGSQTIIAGFKLGVFDVIHNAETALTVQEISKKLKTNEEATERLLDTLVSLTLLEKASKHGDDLYRNTATSDKFLTQSSSNSIKGIVPMIEKSYKLYENLEFAVKEGENQWRRAYNGFIPWLLFMLLDLYKYVTGRQWNVFSLIYATKRGVMTFLQGLKGSCKPEAGRLMSAFDLSSFSKMVDLGGKSLVLWTSCVVTHATHVLLCLCCFTNEKIAA